MKYIYKYELLSEFTYIQVPNNFKILRVMVQDNQPMVWIEQDGFSSGVISLTFEIIHTGIGFGNDPGFRYIDSFTCFDGTFVGHVYVKENF